MLEQILQAGLEEMGLSCPPEALEHFRTYYNMLTEANAVMNLTAIHGESDSARLHFLDSVAPLGRFSMEEASLIDVGTGAGFPGLPLKLLCPSLRLTLLDSQRKRTDFLSQLCEKLKLKDVEVVCGRAEEYAAGRAAFDYAVSRAVARLRILCELCLPFVRVGGHFLALKGPAGNEELREAKHALMELGGAVEEIYAYPLPGEPTEHSIIVIRKESPTPPSYPRQFSKIKKSPL